MMPAAETRSLLRSWPKHDAGISDQFFALTARAYQEWFATSDWRADVNGPGCCPEFVFGSALRGLNMALYQRVAFNMTYDIHGCLARSSTTLACWYARESGEADRIGNAYARLSGQLTGAHT